MLYKFYKYKRQNLKTQNTMLDFILGIFVGAAIVGIMWHHCNNALDK